MASPFFEIMCAGELLIDLISSDYADDLRDADRYRRFVGGSPANLAMNLARLGRSVALTATVGQDVTGEMLIDELVAAGVSTATIRRVVAPTTMILVTKSKGTSEFEAYRSADVQIGEEQLPASTLSRVKIFHTTAFALSREPARSSLLSAAETVVAHGGRLSIDVNYAKKIWPDRLEALWTISQYIGLGGEGDQGTLVKCSEVDYLRLFDETPEDNQEAGERLQDMGAGVVCLTLGEKGCYVLHDGGEFSLPARPIDVMDTTGAGDAFWSGFLAAHLSGKDWQICAEAGRAMAERKLATEGPVRETSTVEALLA